jgi:selenocysteine lyase/cysteine desulfurase
LHPGPARAGTLGGLLTIAQARRLFSPETTYLNTASYGLPPRPAFEALQAAADEWRHGRTGWHGWDRSVGEARGVWARLHRVPVDWVAVGNQVSSFTGVVAQSLPRGSRVVCADGDFTSVLWPFLVAAGVEVDIVALEDVPSAVRPGTALVAVSAVQSLDGRLADLDAIEGAAEAAGARTFVDGTQASGWLPLDAGRFDYLASSGYKWLLSPRGAAWMALGPQLAPVPHGAGWFAGQDPWTSIYGLPLRLAAGARALDTSPAWFSHVGAAVALPYLAGLDRAAVQAHCVGLADRFRAGVGMPPGGSAIVAVRQPDALARLQAAGVVAAGRAGAARLAFHLYNTDDDVDLALGALARSRAG